jgi:hypothetical protein
MNLIRAPRAAVRDPAQMGYPVDQSNPGHVAGANPANVALLYGLTFTRRLRHADTQTTPSVGGKRWPVS